MDGRERRAEEPDPADPDLPERIGGYRILGRLGIGGMGIVYEARHDDSDVRVALKVLRTGRGGAGVSRRFEREAELLRRLRHPGIAGFLEAGEAVVEQGGTVSHVAFLAMELVEGRSLAEPGLRNELDDRQRVELVARICDALEHAHRQGIVHRDLKPDNILVGADPDDPIGQPKILDFGVAGLVSSAEPSSGRGSGVDEPLTTEGQIMGTVVYMSPEQASGGERPIDARSDVYTMGVILFELLVDRMPYPFGVLGLAGRLRAIQFMEPERLGKAAPRLAGDLELVVARALEKEPERRYASARDLADDLRAWLAHRPVHARPPNLTTRTRRFVARRPLASSMLANGALALLGVSILWGRAVEARDLARAGAARAREAAELAQARLEDVERERASLLRLSDERRLHDLTRRDDELWPAVPARVAGMDAWLAEASELASRLPEHEAALATLDAEAATATGSPPAGSRGGGPAAKAWWRETLTALVEGLRAFAEPERGTLARMRGRRELAAGLAQRSLEACADDWAAVIAEAATDEVYAGVELEPQLGLVPLGRDPGSGLFEFWHVASGARPERDPSTGSYVVGDETGIVLVLLPGGPFLRGAQSADPDAPHYDPQATSDEGPVVETTLSPFFISKFELTQGQWLRLTGTNPSFRGPGDLMGERTVGLSNPVERVSWEAAMEAARRLDLELCSEAQWEYAARASGDAVYVCGPDKTCLAETENVADQYCMHNGGPEDWEYEDWDDGHYGHAPVGSYRANAFGLHDLGGNVRELCRDSFSPDAYRLGAPVDPVVDQANLTLRSVRGGDSSSPASNSRITFRQMLSPASYDPHTGFRPARPLRRSGS